MIIYERLITYVLFFAMFSRVLSSVGLPSVINFLHFPLVFLLFVFMLTKSDSIIFRRFVHVAIIFFMLIICSAFINEAGAINVILEFILLIEPLLLVFCIFSLKWSEKSIIRFRSGILLIISIHLIFVLFQYFVLGHVGDNVTGVLLGLGAGAHLSGAIAMSAAIYFFLYGRSLQDESQDKYKMFYFLLAFLLVYSAVFSDAKQVFAVFLLALIMLTLLTLTDIKKTILLSVVIVLSCLVLYEASRTIFPALQHWAETDTLKEGLSQKFYVFSIITNSFDTFLNYLFGEGPGHTVGRLAMLLPDYYSQLSDMGATISRVTSAVWVEHQGHYMSNSITGSSMFSLFFSWAGIFGDLGFLGLSVYLYMYYMVWNTICSDLFSKFTLITVFIFGWVFQWLEEPQYMLFIMSLIGLRWQETQLLKRNTADVNTAVS